MSDVEAETKPSEETNSLGKDTQVLEFALADETYCVNIDEIDEIVDAGELTTIPNSPQAVEGVMDLRGRTTSIIDPKKLFDIDAGGERNRIIVFDGGSSKADENIGWVVDEVYKVSDVDPDSVDQAVTSNDESVIGIIKSDEKFVVWVEPDTQMLS